MRFYVGLHHPHDAHRFERCMVSVNRLRRRRADFPVGEWMLDSGAFTAVARDGGYRRPVEDYAAEVRRWARCGTLVAAVAQDWMCEPAVLARTGLTVRDHQRLTIERYAALVSLVPVYVLPVLQGYRPHEYAEHIDGYGELLPPGAWVGVGSVCKRNADVGAIERVLWAIKTARPDLRLHGFGVKLTALASSLVREALHSADSMAWSYAARRQGRDANSWREAAAFVARIEAQPVARRAGVQLGLWRWAGGRAPARR
jgi:hypothetical protein